MGVHVNQTSNQKLAERDSPKKSVCTCLPDSEYLLCHKLAGLPRKRDRMARYLRSRYRFTACLACPCLLYHAFVEDHVKISGAATPVKTSTGCCKIAIRKYLVVGHYAGLVTDLSSCHRKGNIGAAQGSLRREVWDPSIQRTQACVLGSYE